MVEGGGGRWRLVEVMEEVGLVSIFTVNILI
jgi:hypothetical protein